MTNNDEAVTQEWGTDAKTFDDSKTSAETVAFGEGLDDFELEGGSTQTKHAVMPARGARPEGGAGDGGLFGRFVAWLKGVFGGS